MERLEAKKINGKTYYYYSKWGWVKGKCRRIWQKYIGKAEDILKNSEKEEELPESAEIFRWGLTEAINKECRLANVISETNFISKKRKQGLSTGEYIAIAAMNRAIEAKSKRSMWDWFSQTSLLRHYPNVTQEALESQRFWDHMKKISSEKGLAIWKNIIKKVIERESINLSSVSYDGTIFYTFIDTFNNRCQVAKRGKNKQGRSNLRQISYALFCCSDDHIPLYYDVYDGNRNDAKQFEGVLLKFDKFFKEITAGEKLKDATTFIFDKGNNSKTNFELIDELQMHYVGSVKLGEHQNLTNISNKSNRFISCPNLEGTKTFREEKNAYIKQRVFVVSYNENLFNAQWLTLQNDIKVAAEELDELKKKLSDRNAGINTHGKTPAKKSIEIQIKYILKRPFMKQIIKFNLHMTKKNIPSFSYSINQKSVEKILDTYLGKNIIITDQKKWSDEKIIETYRSQYIVEDVFKEMKDRTTGSWWPLYHWTDSNIHVHGLYCTIALLLKSLITRRIKKTGLRLSVKKIMAELDGIREVVNIFPKKGKKEEKRHSILSKMSDLQIKLKNILGLEKEVI